MSGFLGYKSHTEGNRTVYDVDYDNWLDPGINLVSGATVTLSDDFTATVTDVTIEDISVHARHLTFVLEGGSVNETFTLDVQATNSRGEIKNNTVGFQVSPL